MSPQYEAAIDFASRLSCYWDVSVNITHNEDDGTTFINYIYRNHTWVLRIPREVDFKTLDVRNPDSLCQYIR